MASLRQTPLTCSGHTRPVVHLDFSSITECGYFLISACKGKKYVVRPLTLTAPSLASHTPWPGLHKKPSQFDLTICIPLRSFCRLFFLLFY